MILILWQVGSPLLATHLGLAHETEIIVRQGRDSKPQPFDLRPKPKSSPCSCFGAISRYGMTACSCFCSGFISGAWALLCDTSCPSAAPIFSRSLVKICASYAPCKTAQVTYSGTFLSRLLLCNVGKTAFAVVCRSLFGDSPTEPYTRQLPGVRSEQSLQSDHEHTCLLYTSPSPRD